MLGLALAFAVSREILALSSGFTIGRLAQLSLPAAGLATLMVLLVTLDVRAPPRMLGRAGLTAWQVVALALLALGMAWAMASVGFSFSPTYFLVGLLVVAGMGTASFLTLAHDNAYGLVVFLLTLPFLSLLEWDLPNTWLGGGTWGIWILSPSIVLIWWISLLSIISQVSRRSSPVKSPLTKYVVAWALVLLLSSMASAEITTSLRKLSLELLCFPLLGLLVVNRVRSRQDWSLATLAVVGYTTLRTLIVYYFVLRSPIEEVSAFSLYGSYYVLLHQSGMIGRIAIFGFPLALTFAISPQTTRRRIAFAIVAAFLVLIILVNRQRNSVLSIVFSLPLVLAAYRGWRRRGRVALLVCLVAIATAVLQQTIVEGIGGFDRFQSWTSVKAILHDQAPRLDAWGAALKMIRDHPLLGIGPNMWTRYYPRYSDHPALYFRRDYQLREAHSRYLGWAVEGGLGTLAVFVALVVIPMRNAFVVARKSQHRLMANLSVGLLWGLAVWALKSLSGGTSYHLTNFGTPIIDDGLLFWIAVGLGFALSEVENNAEREE